MTKRLQLVQPTATPLTDLIGDYLQSCRARGLSVQTIEHDYRFVLERIFLPWCQDNSISALEQLDQRALDRYGAELHERRSQAGEKLSKWTVRTYVRSVRFFLAWAEREGEPVRGKPQLPKVGKPVREVLTRAEIDAMERAATCERDKLIVRLLGDCGLRRNEVTGLRITDVKRAENRTTLHVRGKGDRERRVPIHPGLARRLQRLIQSRPKDVQTDRIFIKSRRSVFGTYEPLGNSGIGQLIRWLGRTVGIEKPVHPHLFRHSWMTEMLRRGMNPIQLSVIAGASQEVIAFHYSHLTQDDAYDSMMRAWTNPKI